MTMRIRPSLKGCILLVLLFGVIGANGKCDLAMRIWAELQQQIDDMQGQIDSQRQQIDHLTGAVCGLSAQSGNPTHPDLCEVVITETCGCGEVSGDVSFPHPDSGEVPPPKCGTVAGCRGTFTRIASGDVGSIEVEPNCDSGPSGGDDCECGFHLCGSSVCCNDCDVF
jgi:hypothetical protein